MAYNDGSERFDEVKHLKARTNKQLQFLKTRFTKACENHPQESFIRYLELINLEIASRIGKNNPQP